MLRIAGRTMRPPTGPASFETPRSWHRAALCADPLAALRMRVERRASGNICLTPRCNISCISPRAAPFRACSFLHPEISTSRKEHHMSFHDATVPAFLQILGALDAILGKAETHCKAKNIQPEVLLSGRLYPDMFPFTRQIQTACDFAAKSCARLTGSEVPTTPDTEKSFADLRQRIARTAD